MKKNIVLFAVGGIGYRHFQAIMNLKEEIRFFVIDVNEEALCRAKEYEKTLEGKRETVYSTNIEVLPEHIHVAIVATSSLPRRSVFESLVKDRTVENIIFEKILFPKIEDYEAVGRILSTKRIKAYVDCTARMYDVYHMIKEENKECHFFNAVMKGSNWGLACNAIHLIDQVAFMVGANTEHIICTGDLENEIVESKRKGYIEFFGRIIGSIGEKCSFIIECDHSNNPLEFEFLTDKAYYYVNESAGIMKKLCWGNNNIDEKRIEIPYVSQLTTVNVAKLLRGEEIDLATYEETRPLHEALIRVFLRQIAKSKGKEVDLCPIT